MIDYHLAQINIARFTRAKDHPVNQPFMDALDPVNAHADSAPGFIWRLVGEGNDAISIDVVPDDPQVAVNMSLWQDVDALAAFVYRNGEHLAFMRRRREWFDHVAVFQALWWVPAGHIPTVAEGMAKIDLLRDIGPSSDAFTFKRPFPAPDGRPAYPVLDECA